VLCERPMCGIYVAGPHPSSAWTWRRRGGRSVACTATMSPNQAAWTPRAPQTRVSGPRAVVVSPITPCRGKQPCQAR
jgi:hypothetical protein